MSRILLNRKYKQNIEELEDYNNFEDESNTLNRNNLKFKDMPPKENPNFYLYSSFILFIMIIIMIFLVISRFGDKQKKIELIKIKIYQGKSILRKFQKRMNFWTKIEELEEYKLKVENLEKQKNEKELENQSIKNELKSLITKIEGLFDEMENNGIDILDNKPAVVHPEIKEGEINLKEIKEYVRKCRESIIFNKKGEYFMKMLEPKISIIIPVFNKQNSLVSILRSIQNQSYKNIEIIFIDDCSTDNTVKELKKMQEEDHRIELILNKERKGYFYSRNKAVKKAMGEYVQFLDVNDLLVGNILEEAYSIAEKNKLDIVQYIMINERDSELLIIDLKTKDYLVRQPELSELLFWGKSSLTHNYFFTGDKLIRKNIYIESLNYIGDEYLNEKIDMHEDSLCLFSLYKTAKTYYFLDKPGYYYVENDLNMEGAGIRTPEKVNAIFRSLFVQLKFFYEKTPESEGGKREGYYFYSLIRRKYGALVNFITEGFDFFINILDLYIKSPFVSLVAKENFKIFLSKFQMLKEGQK